MINRTKIEMKKKNQLKKNLISTVLLVLMLMSQAVMGEARFESKINNLIIVPFVGYHSGYDFGQLLPLPNTADVPEITVKSKSKGARIGFSLGYRMTPYLEFQAMFIYGHSEFQEDVGIGLTGVPLGLNKVAETKSFSYSGNVLCSFPIHSLSVYAAVGLGALTLNPDVLKKSTTLLFNYGVGLSLNPSDHLRLILDVRDYVSFFNFVEDFGVSHVAIYEWAFKKSQHQVGIHIGLGYEF